MSGNKKIEYVPLMELLDKTFEVKEYQRGFKWNASDIKLLLKDIQEFDINKEDSICLQPLVVKGLGGNKYELIDGQQRLTSMFLILKYLEFKYISIIEMVKLNYATRERSRDFINKEIENVYKYLENPQNEQNYERWLEHKNNIEFDNVDVYHFFDVCKGILEYFKDKDIMKLKSFYKVLIENVHFIWYEIENDESPEHKFNNLNAGKIPLTDSELIKSLFILKIQEEYKSKSIADIKSNELSLEWDNIENELQKDSFWHFLKDDIYDEDSTRIDILFETYKNSKNDSESNLVKFFEDILKKREFTKNDENKPLDYISLWKEVKSVYFRFCEWYADNEMYHYIGYLVNKGVSKKDDIKYISKIYEKIGTESKSVAKVEIVKMIKDEFSRKKKNKEYLYDIDKLLYKENKTEIKNILLLMNVLYFVNDISENRFPFKLYKKEWSLEHIIPQSEEKNENSKNEIEVQSIGNLTLLDKNTNSSLSNFDIYIKRKLIIQARYKGKIGDDDKNVFIPPLTYDVFLKSLPGYENKINAIDDFTQDFTMAYIEFIRATLKEFLPNGDK